MTLFTRTSACAAVCRRAAANTAAALLLFILVLPSTAAAQRPGALPRSTPEKQGVSSRGLLEFVEAMDHSQMEFHSVMVLRHGAVIAEGWWNPYGSALKHTMYSLSKSFTSTAIGFAVSEHRMSVDDTVISFFPAELPDSISPNLRSLRVRDLLSMSVGQQPDPTYSVRGRDSDWVRSFLAAPIVHAPGTKFLYNTLGSYMLSAIVQKVTGQKVIDYLRPRLFAPLQISGMDWEIDPRGINTGGWGLRIKTEDMAKFGQLYLQHGRWRGKELLPKTWVDEATTMKILQSPDMPQEKRDSSDWQQGYCYQFWRCRHNAFRGDGAFGQLIVVMPDQDAVVVVTAETSDMQNEFNLLWKYLLPAMHERPLPARAADAAALKKKLASLAIPPSASVSPVAAADSINGRTFTMEPNEKGLRSLSFAFAKHRCGIVLTMDTAAYALSFGDGAWAAGTTARPGPDLVNAKANFVGLPPFRVRGSCRWKDDRTLELTLRYIESPHTETFTCTFTGNAVSLEIRNSVDRGKKKTVIAGAAR